MSSCTLDTVTYAALSRLPTMLLLLGIIADNRLITAEQAVLSNLSPLFTLAEHTERRSFMS